MAELNGYIKLYRKFKSWGWYQDNVVKSLFIHLLILANFKETKWQGEILKPGQLITGTTQLANDLGFSRQQIRTALKKLESTEEITIKSTNKYSLITIMNWEDYQSNCDDTNQVSNNQITNNQPTNNQQITNNQPQRKNDKNVNNDKNGKNIDPRLAAELASAGIGYDEYLRIKNQ